MTQLPAQRRALIVLVSLSCAAILFRAQIASALVTRGDDRLRTADVDGAIRSYSRAVVVDRRSSIAADRLAFTLLLRRHDGDAARAYAVARAALQSNAGDSALLVDRAFAAQRLGNWRAAERDFEAAAETAHDPRYAHLAARIALRRRDRSAARSDLRVALRVDSRYAPARAMLAALDR